VAHGKAIRKLTQDDALIYALTRKVGSRLHVRLPGK
jgi:hypothetical protein